MTVVRFLALVAIQVLVMNKVQFNGYLNPYIYILFIILLPLRTPQLAMIIAGFLLGLVVDLYSGMMGIHTAATLFVSYFRNRIMKVVIGITEEDFVAVPGLKTLGSFRFVYYAGVITLIHHLMLFYLEVFSFRNSADTLIRVMANTLVSLLFMVITMIMFERRKVEH
jgi:rod shape-determining protein MreD